MPSISDNSNGDFFYYTNTTNSNNNHQNNNLNFEDDFLRYPTHSSSYDSNNNNTNNHNGSNMNNSNNGNNISSWLQGNDFSFGGLTGHGHAGSSAVDSSISPNLSSLNLDQIRIGDDTMENVLKALDPEKTSTINGLNLDSSFIAPKYTNNTNNNNNNFNRSNIIRSHQSTRQQHHHHQPQQQGVQFQNKPHFFSSPEHSIVNMTLPSMLVDEPSFLIGNNSKSVPKYSNSNNSNNNNYGNSSSNNNSINKDKEQFVSFAVQQYRMLAAMNPEMMRAPENVDDLANRDTFKYWAKLFVEEQDRQCRIVQNLQRALTEALTNGHVPTSPHLLSHLGAASGEPDIEEIGRFADQCRKRSQIISNYMKNKSSSSNYKNNIRF